MFKKTYNNIFYISLAIFALNVRTKLSCCNQAINRNCIKEMNYFISLIQFNNRKIYSASNAKLNEIIFIDETTRRIRYYFCDRDYFSKAMKFASEIREITVINFHAIGLRRARWNLLMQIRRSYNIRMKMILIDDPQERFVSFSPPSSSDVYRITAVNFHMLTNGPHDFHPPPPP